MGMKYDKKQACYYCDKLVNKIALHYTNVHTDKEEIELINKLPPNDVGRIKFLEKLRNLGTAKHNTRILRGELSGSLIVKRRGKCTIKENEYLPCPHCVAFVKKIELYKHAKKCEFNEKKLPHKPLKQAKVMLLAMKSGNKDLDDLAKLVLSSLKDDNVSEIIKTDSLLEVFGSILLAKTGPEHKAYISQRLRQMGRLMIEVKKSKEICTQKVLVPQFFDLLV